MGQGTYDYFLAIQEFLNYFFIYLYYLLIHFSLHFFFAEIWVQTPITVFCFMCSIIKMTNDFEYYTALQRYVLIEHFLHFNLDFNQTLLFFGSA